MKWGAQKLEVTFLLQYKVHGFITYAYNEYTSLSSYTYGQNKPPSVSYLSILIHPLDLAGMWSETIEPITEPLKLACRISLHVKPPSANKDPGEKLQDRSYGEQYFNWPDRRNFTMPFRARSSQKLRDYDFSSHKFIFRCGYSEPTQRIKSGKITSEAINHSHRTLEPIPRSKVLHNMKQISRARMAQDNNIRHHLNPVLVSTFSRIQHIG